MLKLVLFTILSFISIQVQTQLFTIPLTSPKEAPAAKVIQSLSPDTSYKIFRYSKSVQVMDCRLFTINLQTFSSAQRDYLQGKLSPETYANLEYTGHQIQGHKLKASKQSPTDVKNIIQFLIGFDHNNSLLLIVDRNNNGKFTDDTIEKIPTKNQVGMWIKDYLITNVELFQLTERIAATAKFAIRIEFPKNCSKNCLLGKIDNERIVEWEYTNRKEGRGKIGNDEYKVLVYTNPTDNLLDESTIPHLYFFKSGDSISFTTIRKLEEVNEYYRNGDSIILNGSSYQIKFTTLDMQAVELKELGALTMVTGFRKGNFIPNINFADYQKNSTNIKNLPSKYYLLDFWGSWCVPCIESIPELKKCYQIIKDKKLNAEVLSIAWDPENKLALLESLKTKHEMTWSLYWNDRGSSNTSNLAVRQMKVGCFPTYILVSPEGKILIRGCGEGSLREIEEYLQTHEKSMQ